jgi:hypothetical protein
VAKAIKNLRRPITHSVNDQTCQLVTVGYLGHALRRTVWTTRRWTTLGLLPEAPFVLSPNVSSSKRRLYPAAFITRLEEIAKQDYMADRLERKDWARFQREVAAAYRDTIEPLLDFGVTTAASSSALAESGQGGSW